MLDLEKATIEIKFNGVVYSIKEPTVEIFEKLEEYAKKKESSEIGFYKEMMLHCELPIEVVNQLSLRQLKLIMEKIKEVK